MSVILEFTIDDEAFQLGRVLAPPPEMHIALERIVPMSDRVLPYLWVTGDDLDAFEETVRDHPAVADVQALDRLGESGLYRIEWKESPTDLIAAIAGADATVLDAQSDGMWLFRLRFHDHENLTRFHNDIIEQEIPLHIERTYTLTEVTDYGHRFGLTQEQRVALVLALRRGYFASPREVSLDDLAEDLGISRQAVSQRIRRGNEQVLRRALLSSASDFDEPPSIT